MSALEFGFVSAIILVGYVRIPKKHTANSQWPNTEHFDVLSVRPILLNTISQDRLEEMSSNLVPMLNLIQGGGDWILNVKAQGRWDLTKFIFYLLNTTSQEDLE